MVEIVQNNGARLAYELAGPENGPLVITLHGGRGFGSHESDFKAYLPLSDTRRILSFDFRGHGRSSPTKPYTFAQIVEDIESLREVFAGPNPCIVIGESFGGYLAQQYAITYPESLSHLVLRGTAPSHHHERETIETLRNRLSRAPGMSMEMLKDKIFGKFPDDLEFRLIMWAAAPSYNEKFDANKALGANMRTVFNAESHNDLYAESEKYFDYRERPHDVCARALVLVGEND